MRVHNEIDICELVLMQFQCTDSVSILVTIVKYTSRLKYIYIILYEKELELE